MGFRRPVRPVIPGQKCPAERSNRSRDPAVTIIDSRRFGNIGKRTCGRCGRPDVRVTQSCNAEGVPLTAWYYEPHAAPNNLGSAKPQPRDS